MNLEPKLHHYRSAGLAPLCDPRRPEKGVFCFDTTLLGNANSGHVYGTNLTAADKADLLAYLLTL